MGRHDSAVVEEALLATVGPSGRMISYSKSGYREAHPDRVPVFNANICLSPGRKVWHGDLDLTNDEPSLVQLARRTGAIVYVLYEHDGRFENDLSPLIDDAAYSVTPSGHTRFGHKYVERSAVDGTLRTRKLPAERRRRFVLTFGRPRLLRFWQWETRQVPRQQGTAGRWFLYIGRRHGEQRDRPFLVLGLHRGPHQRQTMLESAWYPTPKRHAPRPLLHLGLVVSYGPIRPWLRIHIHPGLMYEFAAGLELGSKRDDW